MFLLSSFKLIENRYSVTLIKAGNKLFGLAGTFNYNGIET